MSRSGSWKMIQKRGGDQKGKENEVNEQVGELGA